MDRGPSKLPSTTSRLIAMAVSLVGDVELVRQAMHCSHEDFREYAAASKESPLDVFDRLVNLIIREQGKLIAKNKELLARIRARHEP